MDKKIVVLLICLLVLALPGLAVVSNKFQNARIKPDIEKCSAEQEEIILCVQNPRIEVKIGEEPVIKLLWINKSDQSRFLGPRSQPYFVTVTDQDGNKLISISEQRAMKRAARVQTTDSTELTEEDIQEMGRTSFGGSDRGISMEPKGSDNDGIRLAHLPYDYEQFAKGVYQVAISRKVPSLEKGKKIEFIISDISIEVE